MSELPETSGNTVVTVVRHNDQRIFHFNHNVPEVFSTSHVWTVREPVQLLGAHLFAPVYLGANGYVSARLQATLPTGQVLTEIVNQFMSATFNEGKAVAYSSFDLVFPVGTIFQYDYVQVISAYQVVAWLNFRYLVRGDIAQPVRECGVLERFVHGGVCDY